MLVAAIVGLDNRATIHGRRYHAAVQYSFSEIFNDGKSYELWAYNIETVMAEKVETILAPRRVQHPSKRFLRCLHTDYNTKIR